MNADFNVSRTATLKTAVQVKTWIWDGLIAPGDMTLFTSVSKTGKTTLLSHLLAHRKDGAPLIGRAVRPGGSIVVSEEPDGLWDWRNELLGFRQDDGFICRPFGMPPNLDDWRRLLEKVLSIHRADGIDLAIFDPLAYLFPSDSEYDSGLLAQALLAARQLAQAGMAIVLVHHPRKAPSHAGLASRGCSSLIGFVDIIMEMYPRIAGQNTDRRRRLLSFSRYADTPRILYFELSENGRELLVNDEPPPLDEYAENWRIIRLVLEDANGPLTRQDVLEQWPSTYPAPKPLTLWRWLSKAHESGDVRVEGTGRSNEPFRYYLPEKLETWKKDPLYQLRCLAEESARKVKAMYR